MWTSDRVGGETRSLPSPARWTLRAASKHRRPATRHNPNMTLPAAAITNIGAMVGDHARVAMLLALMDGRAYTATELAGVAGITPQTGSSHLRRLIDAGLVAVHAQGRHRYHRLASTEVAEMLEGIMRVARRSPLEPLRTGPRQTALRQARSCYRHLAGEMGVTIADYLISRQYIDTAFTDWRVTPAGSVFLRGVSASLNRTLDNRDRVSPSRFCRGCLDWSERRPHLAGALGEALLEGLLEDHWLRRTDDSRALHVTARGRDALKTYFAIDTK